MHDDQSAFGAVVEGLKQMVRCIIQNLAVNLLQQMLVSYSCAAQLNYAHRMPTDCTLDSLDLDVRLGCWHHILQSNCEPSSQTHE